LFWSALLDTRDWKNTNDLDFVRQRIEQLGLDKTREDSRFVQLTVSAELQRIASEPPLKRPEKPLDRVSTRARQRKWTDWRCLERLI